MPTFGWHCSHSGSAVTAGKRLTSFVNRQLKGPKQSAMLKDRKGSRHFPHLPCGIGSCAQPRQKPLLREHPPRRLQWPKHYPESPPARGSGIEVYPINRTVSRVFQKAAWGICRSVLSAGLNPEPLTPATLFLSKHCIPCRMECWHAFYFSPAHTISPAMPHPRLARSSSVSAYLDASIVHVSN
jgi:hypothetical protein